MKKHTGFLLVQALFIWLLCLVLGKYPADLRSCAMFLAAIAVIFATFLCKYRSTPKHRASLCGVTMITLLLLISWQLCAGRGDFSAAILLPPPAEVFQVFQSCAPLMLRGIVSSLTLLFFAMAIALTGGVILGLAIGRTPFWREIFLPIAKVLSPIPPIIYSPYAVALMPSFRCAAALVITLGIFWPVSMNIINRASAIDKRIINSAKALGVTKSGMIFKIYLPYLLPGIIKNLHVTLSTSFLLLTMAEMMGASSGLGYFIKNYSDYANYTNVIAGIILIGIVITLLNHCLERAGKKFIRWKE